MKKITMMITTNMNNRFDTSLALPNSEDPQLSKEVQNQLGRLAIAYLQQQRLGVEYLPAALEIVTTAYNQGEGNSKAVATRVKFGMQRRDAFREKFDQTMRWLKQRSESNAGFFNRDDVGVKREMLEASAKERESFPATADLVQSRELLITVETRQEIIRQAAFKAVGVVLNMDSNLLSQSSISSNLQETSAQAKVLRAACLAHFLHMKGSPLSLSPLYVSDTDLREIIEILSQEKDTESIFEMSAVALAGSLTPNEESFDELTTLFVTYLEQVTLVSRNWMRRGGRAATQESHPRYGEEIREAFAFLPLDPVGESGRIALDPQSISQAEKSGLRHLWNNGVRVGEWTVPSVSMLAAADWGLRKYQYEAGESRKLVKSGLAAWGEYSRARTLYPQRILQLQGEQERLQDELAEKERDEPRFSALPDFVPSLVRLTALKRRYDKLLQRNSAYGAITSLQLGKLDSERIDLLKSEQQQALGKQLFSIDSRFRRLAEAYYEVSLLQWSVWNSQGSSSQEFDSLWSEYEWLQKLSQEMDENKERAFPEKLWQTAQENPGKLRAYFREYDQEQGFHFSHHRIEVFLAALETGMLPEMPHSFRQDILGELSVRIGIVDNMIKLQEQAKGIAHKSERLDRIHQLSAAEVAELLLDTRKLSRVAVAERSYLSPEEIEFFLRQPQHREQIKKLLLLYKKDWFAHKKQIVTDKNSLFSVLESLLEVSTASLPPKEREVIRYFLTVTNNPLITKDVTLGISLSGLLTSLQNKLNTLEAAEYIVPTEEEIAKVTQWRGLERELKVVLRVRKSLNQVRMNLESLEHSVNNAEQNLLTAMQSLGLAVETSSLVR